MSCQLQVGAKWDAISLGQDAAYSAGMVVGVPQGLYDSVESLSKSISDPAATFDAIKQLIASDDIFSTLSDAVKQSYIDRINLMESEYQKAGAGGAYNSGIEAGKLVSDLIGAVAGGVGVAKVGTALTEKIVAKAASKSLKDAALFRNADGIYEVKINSTPLEGQQRLNTPDVTGNGKLNPAEAAAAARLEDVLGTLERAPDTGGKTADFIINSGPNAGKTVDLMYTTKNLSQKEVDGINKFFEKNMTISKAPEKLPDGKQQILDHLNKADIFPVDFSVLSPSNQKIFTDYIRTLPKSQQEKIIIMR